MKIWQKTLDLCYSINELIRSFPKEELYVLNSQIKRVADSVVLNIAEGSTAQSKAVFKVFLNYSLRSAIEVVSCLFIEKRIKLMNGERFNTL